MRSDLNNMEFYIEVETDDKYVFKLQELQY